MISIFCKKKCKSQSANPGNEKPFRQKVESANILEKNSLRLRHLCQKTRKGWLQKKLASKLKKLELNSNNLKLNCKKTCLDCAKTPNPSVSYGLKVKISHLVSCLTLGQMGTSFYEKGSSKHISVAKQDVPQSWGTTNGTFITDKVGDIKISFVEYSASKKVHLQLNIIKYSPGDQAPMYDLIIGKQTLHDLGVILDFKEKTIQIEKILLPMRNIANLHLKPNITRALKHNTCLA